MLTSGLCVWDTQWEGRRAPIYDEWRQALLDYYKEAYGHHSPQYRAALPGPRGYSNGNFEPRVAREVIEALVARETRIRVLRNAIPRAVRAEGRRIAAVDFERLDGGGLVHGDRGRVRRRQLRGRPDGPGRMRLPHRSRADGRVRRVRRLPAAAGRYPRGCLPTPVRAHRAPIEKDQPWQHPRVAPVLMDFDVDGNLGAVEGSVSSLEPDGQPARAVTLSRSYATTISHGTGDPSHTSDRAKARRSRSCRFAGRQGVHRGQQRGVGTSGARRRHGPRCRACSGKAHRRVLHWRIGRIWLL